MKKWMLFLLVAGLFACVQNQGQDSSEGGDSLTQSKNSANCEAEAFRGSKLCEFVKVEEALEGISRTTHEYNREGQITLSLRYLDTNPELAAGKTQYFYNVSDKKENPIRCPRCQKDMQLKGFLLKTTLMFKDIQVLSRAPPLKEFPKYRDLPDQTISYEMEENRVTTPWPISRIKDGPNDFFDQSMNG